MSCTPTPTSTQFTTVVSSSVSTSFSSQVTTLPDTTSTDVITSCLDSSAVSSGASGGIGGGCLSSTLITSTSIVKGGISTTQVPFETTVFVTSTEATNTLFATCTDTTTTSTTTTTSSTSTSTSDTSTSTTQTTSTTTTSTTFTQSLTTALTTPTTTFTTSVNTTLANGSVTLSLLTVTSTLPASSVVFTTSVPLASTQSNSNSGSSSSSNIGAIAGGAVGGLVALIAIVTAIWFYCRRRSNWDDVFEKDYDEYAGRVRQSRSNLLDTEDEPVRRSPGLMNTEPKPYVYGLVGSAPAPPSLDAGVPVADPNLLSEHGRRPSQGSLMLSNTAPSTASSRPGSFNAVPSSSMEHGMGPVSPAGGRAGSPGALGVSINTGPSLSMSYPAEPPSPASIAAPVGTLFIANQDPVSRPASPNSPASAGSPGSRRDTANNASGTSFAGAMSGTNNASSAYLHGFSERQGLQHNDSVSSRSVYSQASVPLRAQSPPTSKAPSARRRTSAGVIVHTDGGRVPSEGAPPSYSG